MVVIEVDGVKDSVALTLYFDCPACGRFIEDYDYEVEIDSLGKILSRELD